MTPPPPLDDLNALTRHILDRLAAAVADHAAPWRTPMLASVVEGGTPTLRTVVLRSIDRLGRRLAVNTDRRSDKFAQIERRPSVEFGFWDPVTREQLRIAGRARLDIREDPVDTAWAALSPAGQTVYRGLDAPGAPLPGDRADASAAPPDGRDLLSATGNGRDALAVIDVTWERWDWLWLGQDRHHRARMRWAPSGAVRASWVVP